MNRNQCRNCPNFRVLLNDEKQNVENKRSTYFCDRADGLLPIHHILFCTTANNGRGGTNVR